MRRIIGVSLGLFCILVLVIVLFEYQPWYNPKTNPVSIDNRLPQSEPENTQQPTIIDSNNLSSQLIKNEVIDKEEFFEKIMKDDYDFEDIQGDFRTKIQQYYSKSLYKDCWDILKNHASIRVITEEEGMNEDHITLEVTYFAPKDNSDENTKKIVQKYDGEYDSVADYVDLFHAQCNIRISRKTDYVQIDENFYEFLILRDNKDKLYSDTVNLKDYEITLWYDPYQS